MAHLPDQHLEDEDPQAPPVHGPRVRRLRQDLGRQELGRAAERTGAVPETHPWREGDSMRGGSQLDVILEGEEDSAPPSRQRATLKS